MIPRAALLGTSLLVAALALTGCGPGGTGGPPSDDATPAPVLPTPTTTPSEAPSTEPDPEPEPDPGTAETPLTARMAYDRCIRLANEYNYAGRPVTPAPFASADVIPRSDGLFYVYIEVTVEDTPTAAQKNVAYECILGGTVETPNDALYGARTRAPLSEREPDAPLPTES